MDRPDAITWHLYPLGFLGAEPRADGSEVHHRLPRLIGWLDYAIRLGVDMVQLGPVFASESHGYDTRDYFRVDPRLGNEADLVALVDAARERGLGIVLDGVFNHVGRSFAPFVEAEQHPDSAAAEWFSRDENGWTTFEGHDALIALNHSSPLVRDHVVAVMRYWLDRGIAGWRLDAAYAVPAPFWREVVDQVRQTHPDAWLFGEVIHGDYAAFVTESGLDSVTQYELWKAIYSSINDGNFFELSYALGRHNALLESFVPVTFVGNHDVTRIASRLADARHLAHALTILFTVPGHPVVYAGDERGMLGVKEERAGGDDAIRPAFPPDPDGLQPAGDDVFRLHQRLIGLRRQHRWLVRAQVSVELLENDVFIYHVGNPDASAEFLVVVLNLGNEPVEYAPPAEYRLLEGGTGPHEAAVFGRP